MTTMNQTVNRQQLNDRLDGLRDAMASVRGCRREERANELMILQRVVNEISAMELSSSQQNPSTEERRVRLLEAALELLS